MSVKFIKFSNSIIRKKDIIKFELSEEENLETYTIIAYVRGHSVSIYHLYENYTEKYLYLNRLNGLIALLNS